ncbi:uncharacterized protein BDR25DRAFT_342035 [Lindgomyces ingoldianus]|uniref:Uncharacterized protein n=1 Tax=Lindgomyces ingoldianus TaxID=673940 RepID=A0ACB6QYJ5_9PLEO|nr:uncharacterized protein BDR25DRAFT_342035 [Lindgomyces ingoldianus]KAF2471991.1 hypothetical protein BDR25DRAFT_342035 [Lindgomyces ingoldianus]
MGTRKAHNKTRLGCAQCKKRRIKCDIKHPTCENCLKRGLECSFQLLAPSSRFSASNPCQSLVPSSHQELVSAPKQLIAKKKAPYEVHVFRNGSQGSSSPTSTTSALWVPDNFRIPTEIRFNDVWKDCRSLVPSGFQDLFDHYEFATSFSLASNDPAKAAWRSFIPELASTHHFLLHSLLAVASLHLARLHESTTEKRDQMMSLAASHMNRTIPYYSTQLLNVNAKNAAALFACSTLTAVYIFRTTTLDFEEIRASVPSGTKAFTTEIIDRIVQATVRPFHGLRGTLLVLRPGWVWVTTGCLAPICSRIWWPPHRVPATAQAQDENRRLCELENLWMCPGREYESHFEHLSQALQLLRETFALVSQLTIPGNTYTPVTAIPYAANDTTVGWLVDRGAIFVWPTIIPREFITLMEQKNREALVLVAHYAILHGRIRNVWWLEGLGANMIIGVAVAIGRENWHLIEWPAKAVGVDLETSFVPQARKGDREVVEIDMKMAMDVV